MRQRKRKFMLMICTAVFSVTACSSSNSFSDPIDNPEITPKPIPAEGSAKTFTTTADGLYSLAEGTATLYNGASMAPTTIEIDANKKHQTIDGFGYAITYSSCYNLMQMNPENRLSLLKRIYSTTEGYGVSYARISLGCNDFSSTEYSYCDTKGSDADPLSNFALYSDENEYVVPILKEILAINPNLKIIAAPWTCPKWMKVDDINTKNPKDSWTDGHLNPDYRETYAKYFVKFIQTMKEKGINIYAVSPQNEPLNKANCASLYAMAGRSSFRQGIGNTARTVNDSKITHAEFLNPDGSYAAVIINEGDAAKSINLSDGTRNFTCNVAANGVVSCKWNK